MLIPVSARDAMVHDGTVRAAGEVFEVPPAVAAALAYQRKVVLLPKEWADRRTYHRRDLRAE